MAIGRFPPLSLPATAALIADTPTGDQLLELRGDALAQLGRFSEAESDFQRAAQIDPWHLTSWLRWVSAALAQNRTNAYSEICAKALAQFTDSTNTDSTTQQLETGLIASWACYPHGLLDYSLPLRFVNELLRTHDDSVGLEGRFVRGRLQYRVGTARKAIEDLERAKQDDPETFFFLAMAHHQLGNQDKAIEQFEHGVQLLEKQEKSDINWWYRTLAEVERKEAAAVLGIPASPSPAASKSR
jgi:tetratricopeptide (TPR) repeat protein